MSKNVGNLKFFSIVPIGLVRSLQMAGEYLHPAVITTHSYSLPLSIWSGLLTAFTTVFSCCYAHQRSLSNQETGKSIEFFTILETVFRSSVLIAGPISALLCVCRSRQIQTLFGILNTSVVLSCGTHRTFLKFAGVFCLVWMCICCLGVVYSVQHTYYIIYLNDPAGGRSDNWITFARKIAFGQLDYPPLWEIFWMTFGKLLCGFQLFAPQMIILYIALTIGCFWKTLDNDLMHFSKDNAYIQKHLLCIVHKKYRESHRILQKLNGIFSVIILLNCAEELIIYVAIIAYIMRLDEGPQEDDIQRIVYGIIGTGNMVLRISASIFCDAQARNLKTRIKSDYIQPDVEQEDDERVRCAKELSNEISGNDNALSGGCFLLNKEYVLTCSGLLLTYWLLIYQTLEGKRDNAELAKLILNGTAVFQDKVNQFMRHVPIVPPQNA